MKKSGTNLLDKKLLFEDFIKEDGFELNLYLTHLIRQLNISEKI